MFWSTFCKVIMKCLDTPAKGPVKKRKKRSQEWPKGNANAVLRYYVTLMKKHIRTAALISGTGTVEHREHFLTFLELFQKVGAQNFDGEIYLGTVFEALGLIAPSFESFSSELTTSVTGLLKALPFTSQMGFIQGLPDGVCKLRVLDALICAHTDRTLTPFNRGNKKWKSLLKEPPSYGKLEECIFALRPSYLSHDLLNWLAFVTTNYAKLLALTSQEGLDTPSPTVKCAAMAYTDNIFSWWKDSSTEYGDVDNAAVPLAASVTFPMLHTLV